MSKADERDADMRVEYNFTGGVRGKYVERYGQGTNVVVLDPDVAAAFPTPKAVNDALREQLRQRAAAVDSGD